MLEGLEQCCCCKLPQWGSGHSPGRQAVLPHLKYSGRHLLTLQHCYNNKFPDKQQNSLIFQKVGTLSIDPVDGYRPITVSDARV